MVPAAIAVVERSGARQNRLEPHSEQNARSAFVVLAGLRNHVIPTSVSSSRAALSQAV